MDKSLNIACIGSNLESKIVIEGLIANEVPINVLITRPRGNSMGISDYEDLHEFCFNHDIHCIDTIDINNKDTVKDVRKYDLDYLFTLGWSQIFNTNIINSFSNMIIGTHPTPLPKRRGRAPVPWTILLKKNKSSVTFFKIDDGIDSGDIILQKWFDIPDKAYAYDVYERVSENMCEGFIEIYNSLTESGYLETKEQNNAKASYTEKRIPEDGIIDFHKSSDSICRLVRAVSYPFPGAFTFYNHKKILVWKADIVENPQRIGTIGQILKIDDLGLLVQTGKGAIWLKELTNKHGEHLNINNFNRGDKLGYNKQLEIHNIYKQVKKNAK